MSARSREIERNAAIAARRRAYHDDANLYRAEQTVACIALRTTQAGYRGFTVNLVAGQPAQIASSLVGTFVARGLVAQP